MAAPNPTTANTDLWAAFLRDSYSPWMERVWGKDGVAAFAEGVSLFTTALMGGAIARLYLDNAPEVSAFVATAPIPVATTPRQLAPVVEPALLGPPPLSDTVPPWLSFEPDEAPVADLLSSYEPAAVTSAR